MGLLEILVFSKLATRLLYISYNRFSFSFEKSLKIANAITWGVVVLNTAQIVAEIIKH